LGCLAASVTPISYVIANNGFRSSLPIDRPRRHVGDIVDHAVAADDAIGTAAEEGVVERSEGTLSLLLSNALYFCFYDALNCGVTCHEELTPIVNSIGGKHRMNVPFEAFGVAMLPCANNGK